MPKRVVRNVNQALFCFRSAISGSTRNMISVSIISNSTGIRSHVFNACSCYEIKDVHWTFKSFTVKEFHSISLDYGLAQILRVNDSPDLPSFIR